MKYTYRFNFDTGYAVNIVAHNFCDAVGKLKPQVVDSGGYSRVLTSVARTAGPEEMETYRGRLCLRDIKELAGAFDHMTKEELCSLYGVTSFDVALPQDWLEKQARELVAHGLQKTECEAYDMVRTSTVMRYDGPGNAFGTAFYLTAELTKKMEKLETLQKPQVVTA